MSQRTDPDGPLRVDFVDDLSGIPAVDRVHRAVVIAMREAMDRLETLGWRRDEMEIDVEVSSPLLACLGLRKRRVFRVEEATGAGGVLSVVGRWEGEVSRPMWPGRRLRLKEG